MPSSDRRALRLLASAIAAAVIVGTVTPARAQEQAQGFAADRLYTSAPGAGWTVMDDLAMHGGIGGVIAVTAGHAHRLWRVGDGGQRFSLVSDQTSFDVAIALTYQRFRFHLGLTSPAQSKGNSGTIGDRAFEGPSLDLARSPDTLSDARLGVDVRLLGEATSALRLGAGAQLIVPSGERADYVTDGTYRAIGRLLLAADVGRIAIAAQLGVHVRPLDDAQTPGSPRGSELLFGVAAGPRFGVARDTALVVGPEVFGETALRAFFGNTTTGVEALLTGRLERGSDDGPQLRFKVGAGGGLHPEFGAPAWRTLVSIEISDRAR